MTMQRWRLRRAYLGDLGTFGALQAGGERFATVELPWRDNQRNVSCIPEGVYQIGLKFFRGKYLALLLYDVPDRTGIFVHVANFPSDIEGCIGPGSRVAQIRQLSKLGAVRLGVADSKKSLERLVVLAERIIDGGHTLELEISSNGIRFPE